MKCMIVYIVIQDRKCESHLMTRTVSSYAYETVN